MSRGVVNTRQAAVNTRVCVGVRQAADEAARKAVAHAKQTMAKAKQVHRIRPSR